MMSVQVGSIGGARPIQPFEGSRPWGGIYAYSIGVGVMREASGTSAGPGKSEGRIGLVVICAAEAKLGTEVGNGVLVWGKKSAQRRRVAMAPREGAWSCNVMRWLRRERVEHEVRAG